MNSWIFEETISKLEKVLTVQYMLLSCTECWSFCSVHTSLTLTFFTLIPDVNLHSDPLTQSDGCIWYDWIITLHVQRSYQPFCCFSTCSWTSLTRLTPQHGQGHFDQLQLSVHSYGFCTAPVYSNICVPIKNRKHWQPDHCLDTQKHCTHKVNPWRWNVAAKWQGNWKCLRNSSPEKKKKEKRCTSLLPPWKRGMQEKRKIKTCHEVRLTCTTTPPPTVGWLSTWAILARQSRRPRDMIFLWISCNQTQGTSAPRWKHSTKSLLSWLPFTIHSLDMVLGHPHRHKPVKLS